VTSSLRTVVGNGGSDDDPAGPRPVRIPHAAAFDGFYAREYAMLVALAHVLTGSRAHAEDIAQEAMLAAYRRWGEVGEMEFPAAWVRRVCANIATSLTRRRMVEARVLLRLGGRRTDVGMLDDGSSTFWSEVRRLPRRQAQCLALFYMYGCSVTETARVLGCSEGTVKTHLARGRSTLAPRLDARLDEGVEP
jgi:RNA polymerase sigma factor (sigma-70 family)